MSISEAGVAALRGCALLSSDSAPELDHVTLAGRSMLLASLFAGHDLQRGDVVALLSEHTTGVYEFLVGVRRAGLVLMVLDPAHTLEQLAFAINTSGAFVVVASTGQQATAQALVSLTPYIRARYGLDADFPDHRSLPLARSAAPVRVVDAAPSGTLHHVIGPSHRPVEIRLPDPVDDALGRAHARELFGDVELGPDTVLVGSAPVLSTVAAQLGTAVLARRGGVAVPRRPTGVEVLRTAFAVDATVLHLTSDAAIEIIGLGADRVLRLSPPGLALVVVDGAGCSAPVRRALGDLWGPLVRVVEPAYLQLEESDCSVTQAEI
ncbi:MULTISPECIES: AMP-binding protein [unclassified Nocardioides]|uniref:AMP-binding protein n=1 Tax=unclassified Nocardioides TaxID=2615069 RepID=UPI000A4F073F|nr:MULTISPECIES: AMP-binding protein [unclassified Nocardioides]